MMNYDIGILTYWSVPNYGAFVQAYALNKILKEYVYPSRDVKHIAYLNPKHYDLYYGKETVKRTTLWIVNPLYYKRCITSFLKNRKKKWSNFNKELHYIPHTEVMLKKELEDSHFNIIITGSDAIWEFSIPDFGDDSLLIGNGLNCKKLLSFATSFGTMLPESIFPQFVEDGLKLYDKISVRDENSAKIVEKLIQKKPPVVLDPTLIWDFCSDLNIPAPKYQDYILVYGTNFTKNQINDIKVYAKDNKIKIISIGFKNNWCDKSLDYISPLNWIGMFKNAHIIVTCTFHGLMFGINYKKKILFNKVSYVNNRSKWLLKELGLLELMDNQDLKLEQVLNYNWDYKKIDRIIKTYRLKALEYFKENQT